ncbi:hypothetical protein PL11_000300 [Lentilactobacillus curieae]|uniref:Uncharacterized protein n=1 Tax=Lentilactobacillus curieae TaxID=1138822 RepID=A0A1S6QL22_9LACO|nr:hypothetical protein PL11_000300 [Lentilactobacillus curieae]
MADSYRWVSFIDRHLSDYPETLAFLFIAFNLNLMIGTNLHPFFNQVNSFFKIIFLPADFH